MEKLKKENLCMVSSDLFNSEENTDFWNQLKQQEGGDILLSCEKNYITAHKVVLIKASNYFNTMINTKTEKDKIIVVHFHKETFVNLCLMLKYVYKGFAYMTKDRVNGFVSFIESLEMRGSFEVQEVPSKQRHQSCKKKLVFPSMNLTTDDNDYDSPMPTPTPSETSSDGQSHDANVFITGIRKRPVSLSSPEVNGSAANDYETPRKRIRFQEFICETCNNTFYSQSELTDHKITCVIDLLYERSNLPEVPHN